MSRAQEPPNPPSRSPELGIDLFGGVRFLGSEWDPVATQPTIGFEFRFRPKKWPLRFLTAVYVSGRKDGFRDGLELELTVTDVGLGLEFPFRVSPRTEFWTGAGATWVEATATFASLSQSTEDSPAAFVNAGFTARLTAHFHLGIEARWLTATSLHLQAPFGEPIPTDVDNVQAGLLLGWKW